MKMLIGGTWRAAASGRTEDVTCPFDGTVAGPVPVAGPDDVRAALDRAEAGAVTWRRTPAHERMRILLRAAELAAGTGMGTLITPRSAVAEMTDIKTVVLHGRPW